MRFASILAAALVATVLATPATARVTLVQGIEQGQALRIARGYGMVRVTDIERDDDGWEIEGRDHRGRRLEVTINRQGRVTKVERSDSRDDDDDD